jgi:hypothetical protein
LGRGRHRFQQTVAQVQNARAQLLQPGEVMRNDHHGQTGVTAPIREQPHKTALAGGVQPTRSGVRGSSSSAPNRTGAISSVTAATARCTLSPFYSARFPSRSTNASCTPTELPVGDAPRPTWPVSV